MVIFRLCKPCYNEPHEIPDVVAMFLTFAVAVFLVLPVAADSTFTVPVSNQLIVGTALYGGRLSPVGFKVREGAMLTIEDFQAGFKVGFTPYIDHEMGGGIENVSFEVRSIEVLGADKEISGKPLTGRELNPGEPPLRADVDYTFSRKWSEDEFRIKMTIAGGRLVGQQETLVFEFVLNSIVDGQYDDGWVLDHLKRQDVGPLSAEFSELLEALFGLKSGSTCCVFCSGKTTCGSAVSETCGRCDTIGPGGGWVP